MSDQQPVTQVDLAEIRQMGVARGPGSAFEITPEAVKPGLCSVAEKV